MQIPMANTEKKKGMRANLASLWRCEGCSRSPLSPPAGQYHAERVYRVAVDMSSTAAGLETCPVGRAPALQAKTHKQEGAGPRQSRPLSNFRRASVQLVRSCFTI